MLPGLVLVASCNSQLGGGAGVQDIHDVTGAEGNLSEREVDIAEDQTEMGLRIADDGEVAAGGTEAGRIGVYVEPEEPDAGPVLLVPVEHR